MERARGEATRRAIVGLLVLMGICGARAQGRCGMRVFCGHDARQHEFPFLAYVRAFKYGDRKKITSYCGGIVISDKWVLTSGHCVHNAETIYVGVGSSNRTNAKYIEMKQYIVHDKFSLYGRHQNKAHNDIALIELQRTIEMDNVTVTAALLADDLSSVPGRDGAVVAGWGRTTYTPDKPGKESPKMLQKITVTIIPCPGEDENPFILCADAEEGSGLCDGDSGGPLLVRGVVQGIASYVDSANPDPLLDPNKHCTAAGTWAVFMAVPGYRAWIRHWSGV